MPPVLLMLPVALLAGAALLVTIAAGRRRRLGQAITLVAALGALATLLILWIPARSLLDFEVGDLGAGLRLSVRLDAVSVAFSVFVLVPAIILLAFTKIESPARAALAISAALLAVQAAGLILTTLAIGITLTAAALLAEGSEGGLQAGSRLRAELALISLLWAATTLYAFAGTDQYAFIPVAGLSAPVFALVLLGALLVSGLVPWRPWTVRLGERFPAPAAALIVAVLFPAGFNLLVRMYQAGDGLYPSRWFNVGLGALGALVALGAALRAQAAPQGRQYFAEAIPLAGGFALLGLALGTPLGVAAAISVLAAAALLAPLPALLSNRGGPAVLLVLVAGLPPALVFATRLATVEAAVTANEVFAYAAIAVAIAWLLMLAASARALRLPMGATGPGSKPGLAVTAVVLAAGGVGMGALQFGLANPAAATVMTFPATIVTGGLLRADTAAGNWPAISLGLLVLAAMLVVAFFGRRAADSLLGGAAGPEVLPVVAPVWRAWPDLAGQVADSFEVPDEFRITGWGNVDRALTHASVWFWVASFGVLAVMLFR